jgi:hypothetical protein
MKKRLALVIALAIMAVSVTPAFAAVPTTDIVSVTTGESVTVSTSNFPANNTFYVYMGFNGTYGINGYLVSKLTTGEGGSFKAKFPIPEELAGEDIIAIRFESVTDSKYFNYNWFYNDSAADNSASYTGTTPTYLPVGFPTFDITAVDKGKTVTIRTRYLPPQTRYAVMMKKGDSSVYTWYEVAGIETGEGNVLTVTFNIPEELRYFEKIAIKLYDINTGFVTYNLFENRNQ